MNTPPARLAPAPVHADPARRYNDSATHIGPRPRNWPPAIWYTGCPTGQIDRASPARYFIPLESVPGLTSAPGPIGHAIACQSRDEAVRRPPEEIGWAPGLAPDRAQRRPVIAEKRCTADVSWQPGLHRSPAVPGA